MSKKYPNYDRLDPTTYPKGNYLIVRKFDRRGKLYFEDVADTVADAKALIQQAQEDYDSEKESKAEVRLCCKDSEGIHARPHTIGYCQQFRDWESFIERFDDFDCLEEE